MITDSQVHIWQPDSPQRPWPQPYRSQPQQAEGFSAEQMVAAMDAIGVDRAVIVPPIWCGEQLANLTALEACGRFPGRFAIMGRFDPLAPGAPELLEGWLDQPGMLGIRLSGRELPDLLQSDAVEWFWDACQRLGIPVALLTGPRVGLLQPIAERHPDLTLTVDHMAAALGARGPEAFPAHDDLLALARYPRVSVKVSSLPAMSAEPFPFADVYPYARSVYDSFGPRRMLWGADLTRGQVNYAETLRHFTEGLDFLSEDDRAWVLGRAVATQLGWPEDR